MNSLCNTTLVLSVQVCAWRFLWFYHHIQEQRFSVFGQQGNRSDTLLVF